ncbi:MAG: chemotaxis protein CheX [Magnetococcales bacterium]|nr:chemotaxis protein CheX [Magnetococcales bacterium]
MNEELSDAIMESVHDIFHGFLALEVFPGEEDPQPAETTRDANEVATVVSFCGVLRGAVVLRTSQPTALILAGALSGKSLGQLSGEALDLLGELTDLIASGMRTRLSSHGEIRLTPPTMVVGQGYTLRNARIFSHVRQSFQVNDGHFVVDCFFLKDFS